MEARLVAQNTDGHCCYQKSQLLAKLEWCIKRQVNEGTLLIRTKREKNRGRCSDCTSLQSKGPIVTQYEDDIDRSSDD